MKRFLFFILAIFTLQFISCKKENPTPASATYTVTEYNNGRLYKKYVYSPNRLLQYFQFNYDGSVTDSIHFFYHGQHLDSLYTYTFPSGNKELTRYNYSNDKLATISKYYRNALAANYNVIYNNFNTISQIEFYAPTQQPNKGQYVMTKNGNVDRYNNEYIASIFNENFEYNIYAYNQYENVLQPFWVIDPSIYSVSANLPVERIINTSATNDGSKNPDAKWYYKNQKFHYEYTFYEDGNVMTKSVLDTSNIVLETTRYEYETNK
tara:strand:- start:3834 stop:4628 length:795 start_codon:yes stop_codon:yes gene_type:complete